MTWWRVEVSDHDGQVVAIEPEMLVGRDITPELEATIEDAARHLLAFIGRPVHNSDGCNNA
jgi:hypothetical protein